jgi:hypothetical protein
MKKPIMILLGLVVALSVSAQKRGVFHPIRPRTYIVVRGYAPLYTPPFNYDPWFYPGYGYTFYHRPTRLDFDIADIKSDYKEKIRSVRQDKALSRPERRKRIHTLKQERDQAIRDATRHYYLRH